MAVQALGGLAEGRRLVGIISHVQELKGRIDRQIVVDERWERREPGQDTGVGRRAGKAFGSEDCVKAKEEQIMVEQNTIKEFLETLSSKAPVPGGGGASALAGALGNALGQMVANLTVGKKKYAAVEAEIQELLAKMEGIQKEFVRLADRDEEVFAPSGPVLQSALIH